MVIFGVLLFLISLLGGGISIVSFFISLMKRNGHQRRLSLRILAMMVVVFAVSIGIVAVNGDSTPPEIMIYDADLEYGQTVSVYELASATDEKSENIDIMVVSVQPENVVVSEDLTSITFPIPGEYAVIISAKDESGNAASGEATVYVADNVPPVFIDFSEQLEVCYGETIKLSDKESDNSIYAVAKDEISDTVIFISDVQPVFQGLAETSYSWESDIVVFDDIGDYVVTLTAEDESGNGVTEMVSLSVIDKVAPDFYGIRDEYDLTEYDEVPDYLDGVVAVDEIDGDLTEWISLNDEKVNYGVPGEYTVVYNAVDRSGNAAEKIASVIVRDTTPPVISLTKTSYSVTVGSEALDFGNGISAADAIDGDLTDSVVIDDSSVDYDTPGTYEVKYTIADSSGNVTEKTASVTVKARQTQSAQAAGTSEDASSSAQADASAAESVSTGSSSDGETVYITKTGAKYHRGSCRYLKQSKIAISKSDAIAQGYDACSVCNP